MGDIDDVHPETLKEETPEIVEKGLSLLSDYGWYLLGFGLIFYFVWDKKLKPAYIKWKNCLDDMSYAAKYHKDPSLFQARQETMEAARRRMQEELEIKAQEYLIKQKEIEETKRLEKISDWERHEKGLGYRSKMKYREEDDQSQTKKHQSKATLKPEYNPLTGAGGSSGYRPPRRSCCSGGGCG